MSSMASRLKRWKGSTMPYGKNSARKHADRLHVCGLCGKKVYGNGYSNHKRACIKREADALGLKGSYSYGDVLDAKQAKSIKE